MNNLTAAGRFLFAFPFALFGINHFLMLDYYVGMLTSFIPFGAYTVLLTGMIMIGLSISIIVKWQVRFAAYVLASLLLIFILAIHIPHLFNSPDKHIVIISFLKDTSLLGGSLMIAGVCGEKRPAKQTSGYNEESNLNSAGHPDRI